MLRSEDSILFQALQHLVGDRPRQALESTRTLEEDLADPIIHRLMARDGERSEELRHFKENRWAVAA